MFMLQIFDMLLNGDLTQQKPYFKQKSGLSDYYNFLRTQVTFFLPLLLPFCTGYVEHTVKIHVLGHHLPIDDFRK